MQTTKSLARNTRIAYSKWQAIYDDRAWPEASLVDVLAAMHEDGLSVGTLQIVVSALKARGDDVSSSAGFMADIKRQAPPIRRVAPILADDLKRMLAHCDDSLRGVRDAAILSLGFAAALRRSELCALNVDDVEFDEDSPDRLILHIRRSKTDQAGHGQRIPVLDGTRIQPVTRLRLWLARADVQNGPLFLTLRRGGHLRNRPLHHSDIPRLVKMYGALVGIDPATIAGHSLRAGFITSAAQHHARLDKIMTISRHKSTEMVMHYIRDAQLFDDHAGKGFL